MTPAKPDHLAEARHAALHAWAAIAHFYCGEFEVFHKDDGPATEADRLADRLIVEHLARHFPRSDYGYLSEEFEDDATRLERSRVWIIDPIDGTNDFMDGLDDFAMHVALAERGSDGRFRPVAAIVYQPCPGWLFSARAGEGAFLEVEQRDDPDEAWWHSPAPDPATAHFDAPVRLAVSSTAAREALVAIVSRSHMTRRLKAALDGLAVARTLRRGSLGVKIADVARGAADFYLHTEHGRCKEWDLCAPHLILEEAGGRVTDLRGEPLDYNQPDVRAHHGVLASNGAAHDLLLRRLATIPELFQ
ncbi:MAG: 3'(2'),5'-bisphosphate nucleotidase CysQ [Candidatus Sumerlaeia bacterium]|nr:3'(2'),5'-bisphosphate nucleotidase CysQ [Candidatus Sumerlaeia bacterium]